MKTTTYERICKHFTGQAFIYYCAPPHTAFDDPQLCTVRTATMIPPFQLLQADYQCDFADALDDSGCADALLYTNPQMPRIDDSADTL